MARPLALPDSMEPLARFVEETPPDRIVGETLNRLHKGADPKALFIASSLAVCRASEIQIDHHGGPLHPIAGLHAIMDVARRGDRATARLAAAQSVAIANRHIVAPEGGSYLMPELDGGKADAEGFVRAIHHLLPPVAEKHLLALLKTKKPGEILDLLLDVAMRRNALDDHYLIYPVMTARSLDAIGWEWAPVILRPVVRWLAMCPISVVHGDTGSDFFRGNLDRFWTFDRIEALAAKHKLLERNLRIASGADEDSAVQALADRLGAVSDFDEVPDLMAEALGAGLSLDGACEALGLGVATIHLRSKYGNPLDVHMQNGVALRRYLVNLDGVSTRTKVLALLSWHTGTETRITMGMLGLPVRTDAAERKGLPGATDALLAEVTRLIETHPADRARASTGGGRAGMVQTPEARRAVAAAEAYLEAGGSHEALIAVLARLVARDDATELHSVAGFHDTMEQYDHSRGPNRYRHLLSAVKTVATGYGFGDQVWNDAKDRLQA